ncbi:MAG: EamA family transporter RarD [Verrucomicrobiales bacterium]|nr:EamA family transporter RarD [Verrucomicrobiales bacterium]
MKSDPPSLSRSGLVGALVAFGLWGVLPVYWKTLGFLTSDLVVGQRVGWTMLLLLPMLAWSGEWKAWVRGLRQPEVLRVHLFSGCLLAANWTLYVWAAQNGRIVEASLGYFISPLISVLIGRVWLGERLTRWQVWSIGCAGLGVLTQVVLLGRVPWVGLCLALSFCAYGLARRQSPLGSLAGLGVETLVWLPFSVAYLVWAQARGAQIWGDGTPQHLLLIAGLGFVTAAPLLGFAKAARELPFSLLGVLQFLAPSGQFLLGAFVYGETMPPSRWASFALIWVGVALFCADLARRSRGR